MYIQYSHIYDIIFHFKEFSSIQWLSGCRECALSREEIYTITQYTIKIIIIPNGVSGLFKEK